MKIFIAILALALLSAVGASAQTTPRAHLAEQKMCAEQSQKVFDEYPREIGTHSSTKEDIAFQLSHFDPKTNICYAGISNMYPDGPLLGEYLQVQDAFEGQLLASFQMTRNTHTFTTDVIECRVGAVDCKSKDEFLHLVRQQFGIMF